MATACMYLKQQNKARQYLKTLTQYPWQMEYAEEFESGWLLLADLYIQSSKYDSAQESLRLCLKYNQSCAKAYEYMGYLLEKGKYTIRRRTKTCSIIRERH
jgi:tetratricopeptide repeat protein 21B